MVIYMQKNQRQYIQEYSIKTLYDMKYYDVFSYYTTTIHKRQFTKDNYLELFNLYLINIRYLCGYMRLSKQNACRIYHHACISIYIYFFYFFITNKHAHNTNRYNQYPAYISITKSHKICAVLFSTTCTENVHHTSCIYSWYRTSKRTALIICRQKYASAKVSLSIVVVQREKNNMCDKQVLITIIQRSHGNNYLIQLSKHGNNYLIQLSKHGNNYLIQLSKHGNNYLIQLSKHGNNYLIQLSKHGNNYLIHERDIRIKII